MNIWLKLYLIGSAFVASIYTFISAVNYKDDCIDFEQKLIDEKPNIFLIILWGLLFTFLWPLPAAWLVLVCILLIIASIIDK